MGHLVHRVRLVSRIALVVVMAALTIVFPISPVSAACSWSEGGQTLNGMVQLHATYQCDRGAKEEVELTAAPVRDSDWDAACVRTAISVGLDPAGFCDLPPSAGPPVPTPGLVARAFRRIPLPEAKLVIQPPNG